MFDFLREVVSKVPDYGHAQGQGPGSGDATMEDRSISKRRFDLLAPYSGYLLDKACCVKLMRNG